MKIDGGREITILTTRLCNRWIFENHVDAKSFKFVATNLAIWSCKGALLNVSRTVDRF